MSHENQIPDRGQFQGEEQQEFENPQNPTGAEEDPISSFAKRIFIASLVAGAAMAVFIYLIAFDSFSETSMVQLSFTWITLIVFGVIGLTMQQEGMKRPMMVASICAIVAMGLLQFFFLAIFPSL